jgi:hypothetical protein
VSAPTAAPTPAPTAAPTPAPTAAPTPAPTPAPAPPPISSSPTVDQIVSLLRNDATRDQVQLAVAEQQTVVTTFVSLLIKEESKQTADDKKAKDNITITDTQCKP